MPLLQDSVFTIWNTIKKTALGISDQTNGFQGYHASFLPVGIPVDKDDYYQPWSPGHTATDDSRNRLKKVCDLVDKMLQYYADGTCSISSALLSDTYRLIVGQASTIGLPPLTDQTLIRQLNNAYKLLYTDPEDPTTKTPLYQHYLDAQKTWRKAIIAYAAAFQNMKVNPQQEATWPMVGLTYAQDISDAYDDLRAIADRVENALALIGSQAKDTSAEILKVAKNNVDRTQGKFLADVGGNVQVLFSEILPSDWCNPDAENWTQFSFESETSHMADHTDSSSFSGGGSVSFGFWSMGGSTEHTESHHDLNIENDSLSISFEYTIAEINRPWMDTLIFRLGNWFLQGEHAGIISDGTTTQLTKAITQQDSMWLPAFPAQMILVKNLFIGTSKFTEAYHASQSYTSSGGSFGWGPFSFGGRSTHQSSDVTIDTYNGKSGLRIKGVQLIGWINEIIPLSPKIAEPVNAHVAESI